MSIEESICDLLNMAMRCNLHITGISLEDNQFIQLKAELMKQIAYCDHGERICDGEIRYAGPECYIKINSARGLE